MLLNQSTVTVFLHTTGTPHPHYAHIHMTISICLSIYLSSYPSLARLSAFNLSLYLCGFGVCRSASLFSMEMMLSGRCAFKSLTFAHMCTHWRASTVARCFLSLCFVVLVFISFFVSFPLQASFSSMFKSAMKPSRLLETHLGVSSFLPLSSSSGLSIVSFCSQKIESFSIGTGGMP